jgi:hypothetical protein
MSQANIFVYKFILEAVIVREAMFGKIIEGHNSRHAG